MPNRNNSCRQSVFENRAQQIRDPDIEDQTWHAHDQINANHSDKRIRQIFSDLHSFNAAAGEHVQMQAEHIHHEQRNEGNRCKRS